MGTWVGASVGGGGFCVVACKIEIELFFHFHFLRFNYFIFNLSNTIQLLYCASNEFLDSHLSCIK